MRAVEVAQPRAHDRSDEDDVEHDVGDHDRVQAQGELQQVEEREQPDREHDVGDHRRQEQALSSTRLRTVRCSPSASRVPSTTEIAVTNAGHDQRVLDRGEQDPRRRSAPGTIAVEKPLPDGRQPRAVEREHHQHRDRQVEEQEQERPCAPAGSGYAGRPCSTSCGRAGAPAPARPAPGTSARSPTSRARRRTASHAPSGTAAGSRCRSSPSDRPRAGPAR